MAERNILVFNLLGEELGLDVACVREVLVTGRMHTLPRAPDFVEGLMNLRGHVIVVVNLRKKFGHTDSQTPPGKYIVVCRVDDCVIGIMIDDVDGVLELPTKSLNSIPDVLNGQVESAYISGIARLDDRVIVILNLERLFTRDDMRQLADLKP